MQQLLLTLELDRLEVAAAPKVAATPEVDTTPKDAGVAQVAALPKVAVMAAILASDTLPASSPQVPHLPFYRGTSLIRKRPCLQGYLACKKM